MRTAARVLVLLAGAVLAAGCDDSKERRSPAPLANPRPVTWNRSDLWRPVVVSECGQRLASPPRQAGQGQSFYVFFACEPRKGPIVDAAAARVLAPEDASPADALRVLLAGPTRAERAAGFTSPFGAKTAKLPFSVKVYPKNGLAIVDLDRSIMRVKLAFVSVAETAEITSTVGQFPGVRRVRILIGGHPLCRVLGEC